MRTGHDVAMLAIGSMVTSALKAAELLEKAEISAEVVNMRFVKPIDGELLDHIAERFTHVVSLEDNVVTGGMGSAIAEHYASKDLAALRLKIHGIPDRFIDHGTPAELQKELSLDPTGIAQVVKEFLARSGTTAHRSAGVLIS